VNSDTCANVMGAIISMVAPYVGAPDRAPCAVLSDIARLCGTDRGVDDFGYRYRDAIGEIVAAIDGGRLDLSAPRAIDAIIATLEETRRHFAGMARVRLGASENSWIDLPEPVRATVRSGYRHARFNPRDWHIDVRTASTIGVRPDRYGSERRHDRDARTIDRDRRLAKHAARNANRPVTVVDGDYANCGTYSATPYRQRRRRK